ncbi:chitinase [Zunongwangia mangrovi]|uniref:chitinase n=1 Tax=Zunongwangia mangrovi TaxID=1334022 RepID=A0A1I1I6Y0_9FLAO|nr:glycoside hydrolase family 18 protein [Zunongwangia mangrovi]SFC31876.1 chitinase [Zunongwangia mangrovi]
MKIKRYLLVFTFYFFGSSLFAQQTEKEPLLIGYVFGDLMEKAEKSIQAEKLTHINYAFANIEEGKINIADEDDPKRFKKLKNLKAKNPSLNLLISVGGWANAPKFPKIASSDISRTQFSNSALQFLKKYDLDGIDLVLEYPKNNESQYFSPENKKNFTSLLAEIRQKLDSFSAKNNKEYVLSIATSANKAYLENIEIDSISKSVDFINIMCYNYHDDWSTSTAHHTNLLTSAASTINQNLSTAQVVKNYIEAGADPKKLVIGVPFYGRGWKKVAPKNNGLYQSTSGQSFSLNYTALKDSLRTGKYHRYWDETAQAPFLWNAKDKIFITYDDPISLKKKAEFIKTKNLAGVMFWQYHADDGELLESLFLNLKNENHKK